MTTLLAELHNRLGIDVGSGADRKVAQARLNRVMTKSHMNAGDVRLVISYAVRHHKLVRQVEGLPFLLAEARVEKAKNDQQRLSDTDQAIAEAVGHERALYGDTAWVGRLIRASGKARESVLRDWRRERGQ